MIDFSIGTQKPEVLQKSFLLSAKDTSGITFQLIQNNYLQSAVLFELKHGVREERIILNVGVGKWELKQMNLVYRISLQSKKTN